MDRAMKLVDDCGKRLEFPSDAVLGVVRPAWTAWVNNRLGDINRSVKALRHRALVLAAGVMGEKVTRKQEARSAAGAFDAEQSYGRLDGLLSEPELHLVETEATMRTEAAKKIPAKTVLAVALAAGAAGILALDREVFHAVFVFALDALGTAEGPVISAETLSYIGIVGVAGAHFHLRYHPESPLDEMLSRGMGWLLPLFFISGGLLFGALVYRNGLRDLFFGGDLAGEIGELFGAAGEQAEEKLGEKFVETYIYPWAAPAFVIGCATVTLASVFVVHRVLTLVEKLIGEIWYGLSGMLAVRRWRREYPALEAPYEELMQEHDALAGRDELTALAAEILRRLTVPFEHARGWIARMEDRGNPESSFGRLIGEPPRCPVPLSFAEAKARSQKLEADGLDMERVVRVLEAQGGWR